MDGAPNGMSEACCVYQRSPGFCFAEVLMFEYCGRIVWEFDTNMRFEDLVR